MVLYQSFFDTLTHEFVEPAISSLTKRNFSFLDVVNPDPIDLDVISLDYNLTNFRFTKANYDVNVPLIEIQYDYFNFSIPLLDLTLEFDYEYVSDPPILADIGTAEFSVDNWSLNFTSSLLFNDDHYASEITYIEMGTSGNQTAPVFDGLSDFSETVSSLAMGL